MAWPLDFSFLGTAILWAGSGYKTSPLVIFVLLYGLTRCIAISPPTSSPFVPCAGPSTTHSCLTSDQCLPLSLKCDGDAQCPDGSDEVGCRDLCVGSGWFRCHNQHCISSSWKCDGENDCMDWSDEDDVLCKAESSTAASTWSEIPCGVDQFRCTDGSCIPNRWTCDRQDDCHQGEDESKALCSQGHTCEENQFTCADGQCITKSWMCDDFRDCDDASDEDAELCQKEGGNLTVTCDVDHGNFLCSDGSLCLNSTQVCDSVPNCQDKSDEGSFCLTPGCESISCEQGCLQTVSGPTCFCQPGFVLATDKTNCLDVDECMEFGSCSQTCTNTPGSFNCSCLDDYVMTNGSCLSTSPETLLLFSTKTEVRGLNLTDFMYFSVASNLPHVIGIGYDAKESKVYWTDVMAGRETIHSSKVDGSGKEELVTSGLDMPEDLVVDEVSRNLYFTDSISKHLAVCKIDGASSCAVLARDMEQPRAIALHHGRQLVLFTDWGTYTKGIGMLGMDGTGRSKLVSEHLGWPNGIAVDEVLDRVFWSDAKLDRVESIKLDGTDRRIVLDTIVKHPFSLDVFEDRLYWSDWENKDIMSCNKFTGKELQIHVKEVGVQPYGITVSNPVRTKRYSSPCWPTSPCSHICLPSKSSHRCLCPAHLTLLPDMKTCSASPSASSFLLSTARQIYQIYPQTIGLGEFTPVAILPDGQFEALEGNGVDNTVLALARQQSAAGTDILRLDRNQGKLLPTGAGSLTGSLAFDPRSLTVFWTDLHKMAVMAESMVTRSSVQVVSGLANPLSLLVVPKHNRLLLGEQGKLSLLRLGPQDIGSRSVVSTAVTRPIALAYSQSQDAVYIGDPGARAIFRWVWGTKTIMPLMQNIGEVRSLATKDNVLYWVEEGKPVLFWVTLDNHEISWMSLSDIASSSDHLHITISGNNSSPGLNLGCLSSSCSHLCIPGDTSVTCGCPYGMDLAKDGLTCQQDCPDNVFSCGDGQCVPQGWRCDGSTDCNNSADEANCSTILPASACNATTQVACSNGDCLIATWWCDGDIDCIDGSDESRDCPTIQCGEDRFSCKDGKQCVVNRWKCDGDPDCRDGSDEEGCGGLHCGSGEFACTDGLKCIQDSWRCDSVPDCHDASDETDCSSVAAGCAEKEFQCSNGNCVDIDLLCDRVDDCGDNSEEETQVCHNRTDGIVDPFPDITCRTGFKCGLQCLHSSVRCNGTWECPDYSDELDCPLCTRDTFRCNNGGRCVPRSWVCDRVSDCSDGSDEWDCEYNRNSEPSPAVCDQGKEFQCLSGECVPLDRTCNRLSDCADGSDEGFDGCSSACLSPSACGPEQDCLATPRGPVCVCRQGYQLDPTSGLCQDTDECLQLSSCAQHCTNTKGSYKCSCEEGFESEVAACRPLGLKPKFLYALDNTIRAVIDGPHGQTAVHPPLTTHAKPVASFVQDSATGDIYWSSPGLGIIGKRADDNRERNEVWLAGLDRPAELALDWRAGNLYYSSQRHAGVTVCSTARRACKVVVRLPEDAVTKLAVDPRAGMLFVAGYSRKHGEYPSSHIYPFTMDGRPVSEAMVIGSAKTGMVSGLALDPVKKLVFWSDLTSRDIQVCSYLGTDCSVVVTSSQSGPAGLVAFTSKLFWTTSNFGWLHSHQIISNTTVERTLQLPATSHSLSFSHPSLQPPPPSPCPALACPHLCLLSSPTEATCACPDTESSCLDAGSPSPAGQPEHSWKKASDGPSVVPVTKDNSSHVAVIVVVVILLLLFALCLVFVKCRTTKQGTEMGIRFTNMAFGVNPGAGDAGVELDNQQVANSRVTMSRIGSSTGYDNPGFDSPQPAGLMSRAASKLSSMRWPDSPDIDRDTPVILEGHSTPRWMGKPRDTDSAFQEPSTAASSYEDDESHYLSGADKDNYKDKHRLLDD